MGLSSGRWEEEKKRVKRHIQIRWRRIDIRAEIDGKIDIENPGHATNKEKIERYDPYGTLWDGGGGGPELRLTPHPPYSAFSAPSLLVTVNLLAQLQITIQAVEWTEKTNSYIILNIVK